MTLTNRATQPGLTGAPSEPSGSSCSLSISPLDASHCHGEQVLDNPKLSLWKAPHLGWALHEDGANALCSWTPLFIATHTCKGLFTPSHRGHTQPTSRRGRIDAISFPTMLLIPPQTHSPTQLSSLPSVSKTKLAYQ